MTYGQSSGQTLYNPPASSFVIDAFDRCGIYDIQSKHMQSAARSLNLLATSAWSNRGANLFRMQEVVIPLYQGVINYFLSRDVATVYECFRRQYYMNAAANFAVNATTVLGSPNVTLQIPGATSAVGTYIGIAVPIAIGGLVLSGFYPVIATPTVNSVTITAPANATAGVSGGGIVPEFTTTINSQNVTVTLADHGYLAGQAFVAGISTAVGGIAINGSYIIQSITDTDNFVILAASNALSGASAFENGGETSISTQNVTVPFADIGMAQLSRTDYVLQADKTAPGAPTTLWVNKQIIPEISLWPVTDSTGPYELHLWVMKQIEDIAASGGQTLDMPPRFYYAFVADLARDLSIKFAPSKYQLLRQEAMDAWAAAEATDIEPVSTFIMPQMPTGLG